MKDSEIKKEVEKIKEVNKKAEDTIYSSVKNLNDIKKVDKNVTDALSKKIDIASKDSEKEAAIKTGQELSLAMFKNVVKNQYPEQWSHFKNMTWEQYSKQLLDNPAFLDLSAQSNTSDSTFKLENEGASVQISPNMFFKNVTTILNTVSVGKNGLDLSGVFNAFDFYNDGWLQSGISKLYTQEYTAAGVIFLDQNQLVPQASYNVDGNEVEGGTQNIAGYQASHPVFANVPYADAGIGKGWGLFTRGNEAVNVWKLSVTSPEQYAQMNILFLDLMTNSKDMAIWAISTNNFLNNVTNLILDNTNTNIRDCMNFGIYPNIIRMTTPTQMYNLGDSLSVVTPTKTVAQWSFNPESEGYLSPAELDTATSATRNNVLSSNYLIQGYNTLPRINSCNRDEIYIIMRPELYVLSNSGLLSVLYNYGLQSWDYYIPKDHIKLLYKKPNITATYLNPKTGLSAHLQPVTMDEEWFDQNSILIITKPKDNNMWPATYGYVWNETMSNKWGAAMVETTFLHFLIYGGVTPYAQAFWYHSKGLSQPLATSANVPTETITYNANTPVTFTNPTK